MWFKNIQLFELTKPTIFTPKLLAAEFEKMAFTPCAATLPSSSGWVSPSEEDYSPLVHAINGYMLICLQVEDKILPATVVRQELKEKIKDIETIQQRKVLTKEKYTIKDSIYNSLLPKAFTKKNKIYAYFDTKNNWLIVDTVSATKLELFLNTLKKTLPNVAVTVPKLKKLAPIMTQWLLNNNYPSSLGIEKTCVLQDPSEIGRKIRCQQQDLSARTVQALLKDGYEVSQLALSWQDQVALTLKEDFSISSLKYQDAVLELAKEDIENQQEKFAADFVIMTDLLSKLLCDLIKTLNIESDKWRTT